MASSSNSQRESNGHPTRHERSFCCFQEWMQLQHQDLTELLQCRHENVDLTELVQKCVSHFEEYVSKRTHLAEQGASLYFAPTWCSSFETSMFWIAGCRPSIFIRLIYALSGFEIETRLSAEIIEGMRSGNLRVRDLSMDQLTEVNELHLKTVQEERKLTRELAKLQEEIADEPIAVITNQMERIGEVNEEANKALGDLEKRMKEVMKMADELRMKTMKEILGILNPTQAVEYMVASKKLHLTMHEWGKSRDEN